jgi:beta-lactamase family protein
VIAPPPPPALVDPGTAFGSVDARVGARTDALLVLVDGRRRLRIRLAPGPRRVAVPVPTGEHVVQVEARGPGGARRSRAVRLAVLPASGRRLGRLPGWIDPRLQADVERLAARLPAISGVYLEHLVSGCGAALEADAQFPGARTQVIPRLLGVRDATKLAAGLPAGTPVVHKTGYTKEVKHDAGIAYLRSGPVVAAVMTWRAGGVSDAVGGRFIADVARAAARRLAAGGRCSR